MDIIVKESLSRMAEHLMSSPDPVHLVITGAITNIALLLFLYPSVKDHLAQIVFMGGAMGMGNRSPVAEFNILCDPEAAQMLLLHAHPLPVAMVPLEVTHSALVTPKVLEDLRGVCPGPFGSLQRDLLLFFKSTYQTVFGFDHPPLHDPCAVFYVLSPLLFKTKKMRVDIVVGQGPCKGQTICDAYGHDPRPPNVTVCEAMDVEAFWAEMIQAWVRAQIQSPLD